MEQNGNGWAKVAAMALIMMFVLVVVYVGGKAMNDSFGDIGKAIWFVVLFVVFALVGLAATQLTGVFIYRGGVRDGTVAVTQGIDATVDALSSDNKLDVAKIKFLGEAMKPQQQAHITDDKLRLELHKAELKLKQMEDQNRLRLGYNEQANEQRRTWKAETQAERDAETDRQRAAQAAATNEANAHFAGFDEDDDDDEELEFDGHDFWNGSE